MMTDVLGSYPRIARAILRQWGRFFDEIHRILKPKRYLGIYVCDCYSKKGLRAHWFNVTVNAIRTV